MSKQIIGIKPTTHNARLERRTHPIIRRKIMRPLMLGSPYITDILQGLDIIRMLDHHDGAVASQVGEAAGATAECVERGRELGVAYEV